ncbi:MAG: iron ABC transporter permease [Halothiobacillaceae bacterium]|jgi:iron complex transport system permease protein|nr:iron ABC transporter permease [Halothiobacillaceae bacterium]MDY0049663.1 iron ABC transporter permease [Halothiobacillaceae bacterium]
MKPFGVLGGLSLALLLVTGTSLLLGRYDLAPSQGLHALLLPLGLGGTVDPALSTLISEVRLPRVAGALLIGAALAISGTAFQALFMNPLVSPGVLGVLSGAAFGAALALLAGGAWWLVQTAAFLCGLLAVALALWLGRRGGENALTLLVLGGMISGALFTAFLSVVKYVADPYNTLPAIVYWLMGSLALIDATALAWSAPLMGAGILLLAVQGHALNVMSLGDDEARALGLNVKRQRLFIILLATLLGAMTVVLAGMIGWVGLVIPHIARLLFGADNRLLLPASALLGALYLVLVDDVARLALTVEIPLGILTALIGLPVFAWALRNVHRGWRG